MADDIDNKEPVWTNNTLTVATSVVLSVENCNSWNAGIRRILRLVITVNITTVAYVLLTISVITLIDFDNNILSGLKLLWVHISWLK